MNTAILGTGSYLPEDVLTSAELGSRLGVDEQWILDKTRIKERRVAAMHQATTDLATEAARRALEAAKLQAGDIDLVILATSTPDQPMPASACTVQANLGATQAAAFDIDAVCTGFMYALSAAHGMLATNPDYRHALVIGADTYSRVLNYDDPRTCILFGDGAGAVVLGQVPGEAGFLASLLGSDGRLAHLVEIPGGGSKKPASECTVNAGEHFFAMRGREVRALAETVLPDVVLTVLKSANLDLADVDIIVPHQANGVMLDSLIETLDIDPAMMHRTIGQYGNTGAASVPITLDDAVCAGRIGDNDTVLFVAFGGGMTWGGAALRWTAGGATAEARRTL